VATTAETEVTLRAPRAWTERLAAYGDELGALLIVAAVTLETAPDGAEPSVEVRRSERAKCERCWMYRSDVGGDAAHPALCTRCVGVLAARA
jgi:isoleucyl-tRNA synthetase